MPWRIESYAYYMTRHSDHELIYEKSKQRKLRKEKNNNIKL